MHPNDLNTLRTVGDLIKASGKYGDQMEAAMNRAAGLRGIRTGHSFVLADLSTYQAVFDTDYASNQPLLERRVLISSVQGTRQGFVRIEVVNAPE